MIEADQLGAFEALAEALGITVDGALNTKWFEAPMGDADAGKPGLATMFHDDQQRNSLLQFVDDTLGAPDNETRGDGVWVPLFSDSGVVISAVVTTRDGSVLVGFGVAYDGGATAPSVSLAASVNVFQFSREGSGSVDRSGSLPDWLILGRQGGTIDIDATAVLSTDSPASGEPFLGGIGLGVSIPTSNADSLSLRLVLDRLQLPGTDTPRNLSLDVDSLSSLDDEVYDFLLGLIQAQAEALDPANADTQRFAGLAGILGLRRVPNLPEFPLGELVEQGAVAFTDWIDEILADDASLDAWLAELARLLGAIPDAARNAVTFSIDDVDITVGLRLDTAAGDGLVLVPWAECSYGVRTGAQVAANVDILAFDTTTRHLTAFPALNAHAVFGQEAGASTRLLTGDPQVGTIRTGISLVDGQPVFALTLYDVVIAGATHASIDLSSPDAALEAAVDVAGAALDALAGFGRPGEIAMQLFGLQPPAGLAAISVADLFANPADAVATYWQSVIADSAALAEVIGSIAELLLGAVAAIEGDGTAALPWRIALNDAAAGGATVELAVFVDGTVLAVDLTTDVETDAIGEGDMRAVPGLEVRVGVARLDVGSGTATLLTSVEGAISLRGDGAPLRVPVGDISLVADAIGIEVAWSQHLGLAGGVAAPGLALDIGALVRSALDEAPDGLLALPVPRIASGGASRLTFDPEPDWDTVELLVATLVERSGSPALRSLLELIGWSRNGAHLDLGGLLADPDAAIRSWLGDLVLDCDHIHAVLGPIGSLFRGLRPGFYYGAGSAEDPLRVAIGTNPSAPGLAVWTDTACPRPLRKYEVLPGTFSLEEPPEPEQLAGALHEATVLDRDLDLLMFGRTHLGTGIAELADRMIGTDGVVARPATLPTGVDVLELGDRSYRELVAAGSAGELLEIGLEGVTTDMSSVVHVGCEAQWSSVFDAGRSIDARVGQPSGLVPAAGGGRWSVRLSTPREAAADRPDLSAVDAQAARLTATLAGRTDPITVVAYGGAGAAALAAAHTLASVVHVITVGAPWSAVATTGFTAGLSGDALRCLDRVGTIDLEPWTEELLATEIVDEVRGRLLLDRALQVVPADLPSAAEQAIRSDLTVTAVFGHLNENEVRRALGAIVATGLGNRLAADAAPVPEPTSLHVGMSLPVIDTALAGIALGAGVTVQLVTADRGPTGDGFDVRFEPTATFEVRFGVEDGWLVGGPGAAQHDVEVRWMSAIVNVPIGDGGIASCELILHDARCFGVDHEKWRVARSDTEGTASTPTSSTSSTASEVHIMVGEVVDRLAGLADARAAQLVDLLQRAGLIRNGGFDPEGLDRLIFDTADVIAGLLAGDRAGLAAIIRTLGGLDGAGTGVIIPADTTTITFDLTGPSVTLSVEQPLDGIGAITASASLSSSGATAAFGVGVLDAVTGGVELTGTVDSSNPSAAALGVRFQPAGGTPTTVALLPVPATDRLPGLLAAIASAALTQAGVNHLRSLLDDTRRSAVDTILDGLGLLRTASDQQLRGATLPIGLILDPPGWLRHAAPGWRRDPIGQAVALFDALVPLAAPDRIGDGWPLSDAVSIDYRASAGRLVVGISVDVDQLFDGDATGSHDVNARLGAGLSVGLDGSVEPSLDVQVTVDNKGLSLRTAPGLAIDLLRPPMAPLPLYPNGPGLGQALGVAVTSVLPTVLDAVADERNNPAASLRRSVGQTVFDLGSAMGLTESDSFDSGRIQNFAADPAAALSAHAADLVALGLTSIADALDNTGAPAITARTDGPGRVALSLGTTEPVTVVVDGGPTGPAIEITAHFDIADVGRVSVEPLRLATTGAGFTVSFDSIGLDVGNGNLLFPTATVRAGVGTAGADRLLGVGLGFEATMNRSVELRWSLDTAPPRVVVVDRSVGEVEIPDIVDVAASLCTLALGMAVQIAGEALGDKVFEVLDGVLFTAGTRAVDASLIDDIDDVDALLNRVGQLALNVATMVGPLDIGGILEVALVRFGNKVGIGFDMVGGSLSLATGDTNVDLVSDDSWITAPGDGVLNVWLFDKVASQWVIDADVALRGLGLRVSKMSGPLLDLGPAAIDAIAFHLYTETNDGDIGIGAQIRLDGLSISPSGGGTSPDGDQNSVANGFMADAADGSSPSARPAFSPSIAVQAPPGGDVGITVRAGETPGPWWIVIQRQLGPLYLEQFGFDSVEENGTVVAMSLLFDARVEIFGLAAQVDRLGVHWLGGDALDIGNWRVDLEGLAISADFAGISISGGLIKTKLDGNTGYVGMLMGRFGVYGLSLFGGYTDQDGVPSFFVFGAVNGPIGGPPAFFITGIGGGLGINRGLRVPDDVGQMNEYPFVKALDPAAQPADNPLDELRALAEYFPPENGTFWFAGGISFNSFALVDGVAVVSVSFGNGLEINLFGLARMALPRPEAALVSIELGLLARFSTAEGLFLIQAQLTENSWLLYPEVRLTGGFAFATWWKGANRGQFVLTIGGYHPDFRHEGYPVVPRVGLEWRISDAIVVKGGSYFALTSEALMAGVEVVVSADFGFLWAEVRFGADGIVWFDPFYFRVSAYAKIRAGCRIKTWFGTIRISISMGASIVVQGPKFNGVATVEVGPFEASVPFGSKQRVPGEVIGWGDFVDKYLETATPGVARGLTGITGKGTLPAATGGDQSAPSSDGSAERPYQVFPEFEIALVTPIPFTVLETVGFTKEIPSSHQLGIRPMGQDDLLPTLHLTLQRLSDETDQYVDDDQNRIAKLRAGLVEESPTASAATWGTDGFPLGVWGEGVDPDPEAAPLPAGDVVIAASRLKLVAEADFTPPTGPPIDYRQVEHGRRRLPLTATAPSRAQMLSLGGALAQPTTVAEAMIGAGNHLFATIEGPTVSGAQANGVRSGVGRAAFARSRTAPPRFGSLTDGMLPANPDGVAPGFVVAGVATERPGARLPFVSGYMTVGAGVVARTAGTTVGDGSIKRRGAPSTASVTGRLGRELPVRLARTAVPADVAGATMVARGSLPRTDVSGATRSYHGARIGGPLSTSLVVGIDGSRRRPRTPRALDPGASVRPGDVVVLTMPDPDRDRSDERPELKIDGRARVVMVRASGRVLADRTVTDEAVELAPRAKFVLIQADGGIEPTAGAIGWHGASRLAAASGSLALGSGCVVHTESSDASTSTGWIDASAFTRRSAATTTTFDRAVRSVAIAVRSTDVERVRSMAIELRGAERVQRDGRDAPPIVIQAGEQTILVFEVIPHDGDSAVSVRVLAGGDRRLCGVLGSMLDPDALANALAERGVGWVGSRLRAGDGTTCTISWSDPRGARRRPADDGRRRDNVGGNAGDRATGDGVSVVTVRPSGRS